MQALYGILAMALVALLSLTVMQAKRGTDNRILVNEMATQASGVGVDILEAISRFPFDSKTDTLKVFTFPAVTSAAELTADADFGGATSFADAEDIDDFDGVTLVRTLDGFDYSVAVEVRYVVETTPDQYSGAQTFAKSVRLQITNPHIFFGDRSNPLTIEMRRVFTYQKATSV
jgi:hypothetical protein